MKAVPVGKRLTLLIFLPVRILHFIILLQSLYNVPETKVTTISNGLKVATEDSGLSTATVYALKLGLSEFYFMHFVHVISTVLE